MHACRFTLIHVSLNAFIGEVGAGTKLAQCCWQTAFGFPCWKDREALERLIELFRAKQLHKERFPGSNLVERTEVEAAMQPEQMFDWICYGFSPRTVPAFLEKRRIQASIEMTRKYHLTWLHFDGLWQVHGTLHQLANRHVLSVLDVAREHTGLQPLKAPGVFHSDNRVGSGNHALECEASI